jgi:adenylyl cyclase-associated protein
LLTEAKEAESLDALQLVGEKMASISKGVPAALGNYASALTETIPVFQWKHLQASGVKPGDFISGCRESAQFYLNRIRVELKNKGEQSQWVSAVEELLQKVKASSSGKDVAAPPAKSNAPQAAAKQAAKGSSEPAVTLNGNKWTVENGSNSSDPVTIRVESFGQAIFVDNCAGLTIVVEGKVNAIAINRCKKLKVQVGDVVSNIEALTSNGCDLFLQGSVPTVVLDNCEGVRMFLTERSKAVQVLSSKCSELNLVASRALLGQMGVEDAEETVEIALPFQFKSVLGEDGHIHTEPVKHAGA